MKPIKICLTSLYAYHFFNHRVSSKLGGAELQLYYLARGLAADPDFKINFIVGDFNQPDYEIIEGVKLYKFSLKKRNFFILWKLLKKINADLYLQRAATIETIVVGLFCWLNRKKFLYFTAHDGDVRPEKPVWLKWGWLGWLRWQFFKFVLNRTDLVVAQHQQQRENFQKYYGHESIVRNSAHPLPDEKTKSGKAGILWVGRCEDWKRPELFVWLAKQLPQFPFVMIMPYANDEKLFRKIKQAAQRLPNLKFLEFVPFHEIGDYFCDAKIFINTSIMEGFPNTLIQAIQHGTLFLSLGVNPDQILERFNMGKNFTNIGELKKFLEKVMIDGDLWNAMSENAYRYFREHHDLEIILAEDKKIIKKLVGGSGLKVVFAHPAIRQYRYELYRLLEGQFNIKFLFTEDYDHNLSYLKLRPLKKWRAFPSSRFPPYSKGACWPLVKEAISGDYDIWISSILNSFATHWTFLIVKLRGKKFFLWSEDWWWQKSWKSWLIRPYARFIARHADAVLAAGSRTKIFFVELGVDPQKIYLAFNATTVNNFSAETKDSGKFVILYLGRIVRYKGLDILIKAFSKIENSFPQAVLRIVGDGGFKEECQLLAKNLGLKNIEFIGSVDPQSAAKYYLSADCFVLPARYFWDSKVPAEAWGFTVNEALSSGLPTIVTDAVAAGDDLIEDGINGFKIKTEDINVLSEKLRRLCDNGEFQERMSQAAREKMKNFTSHRQFKVFSAALNDEKEELLTLKKETSVVHGWLSDGEGECLYYLAKAASGKGVIVEIGSWQGKSTVWLAKGSLSSGGGKIHAIDPHTGAPEQMEEYGYDIQTFERFKENINKMGVQDVIIPLVKTSEAAFQGWRGDEVSLLFIDGSHVYEDVKKDFTLWEGLVRPEGVIVFHDSQAPGPSRVLEEFIYSSKNFRVVKVVESLTVVTRSKHLPLLVYWKQRLIGFAKFSWRKLKLILNK